MKERITITIDINTLCKVDETIQYPYIKNRSQAVEELVKKGLRQKEITSKPIIKGMKQRQHLGTITGE
jgi:metal-responsive CopG/Arc/MetJ family transcriptional regulator